MKNKGFTLIELLAVIVILAIIALIAVPIILGIINDAKEESLDRSAENYLRAVKNSILQYQMKNPSENLKSCNVQSDGNLMCDGNKSIEVGVEGTKATAGTLIFTDGNLTGVTGLTLNGISYGYSNGKLERETIIYVWYDGKFEYGPTLNTTLTASELKNYSKELPTDTKAYLKYKLDKTNKVTNGYLCVRFNETEDRCLEGIEVETPNIYGWVTDKTDSTGRVAALYQIEQENIPGVNCIFDAGGSYCSDGSITLLAEEGAIRSYGSRYCYYYVAGGPGHCAG